MARAPLTGALETLEQQAQLSREADGTASCSAREQLPAGVFELFTEHKNDAALLSRARKAG